VPPVNARQAEIRHDDVEGKAVESLQGGFTGSGLNHFEAGVGQTFSNHAAKRVLVIDQQKMSF